MRTANLWSKFYLYGPKIIALLALLFCVATQSHAQTVNWLKRKNPNYEDKKLNYGFLIGLHTTAYQLKYSEKFVSPDLNELWAVEPSWSPGFALGFIVNYKLEELFDLRLTPQVAFYEHRLKYVYLDAPTEEEVVETTMVEFPILLKFKSEKRDNLRMYMIGGVKPAIEASGKRNLENVNSSLEITGGNLSLDVGFGLDLYYPLFKFSPELRFSRGIVDVLDNRTNKFGAPLERLNTNTVTLYLIFQ
jgi:hypothetical protein